MFIVYVLESDKTNRFYIGSTEDPEHRLAEHNLNLARATKNRGPWRRVHLESYATRSEAVRRERFLKTGRGRDELHRILKGRAMS